ncbi:amino acid permease [Sarcoptes scabiei]|nr:amino acid permease [Sarcoptes scabiei]
MRTNPSTRARALPAYRNQFFSISGFFLSFQCIVSLSCYQTSSSNAPVYLFNLIVGFLFYTIFFSPIIHHNSLLCSIAFTHSFLPFLYLSQSILDLNKILMLSFGNHIYPQTSSNEKRNPSQPKKKTYR